MTMSKSPRDYVKELERKSKAADLVRAAAPELYSIVKRPQEIMGESQGIAGHHLNGALLAWPDFDPDGEIDRAISKADGSLCGDGR